MLMLYICILNPLQEAVQPEGDTDFSSLAEKIQMVMEYIDVPVIAKEVGCGFSAPDLLLLKQTGIRWIDVAGRGGTSWSRLENHRRQSQGLEDNLGIVFQDWGIPTPMAIRLAAVHPEFNIIASGGFAQWYGYGKKYCLRCRYVCYGCPFITLCPERSRSNYRENSTVTTRV